MDTDQLITEAEVFSPPKASMVYEDSLKIDVDEFKKIPHGLSHKHAVRHSPNRRNSTNSIRAPLSAINSSPSSPKHIGTYTCPRSNTYSSKQLVGLNKLKANLDSKLKNATFSEDTEEEHNKENCFATPSKILANQQHQSSLLHTPSLSSKRRSSEVTDSFKRLKPDDSLLKTPLRPTELVAASPSNEQNSRIIDNSHLLLDTRKSPNVSSALTSPLANVSHMNSSHINHSTDVIENIDAHTVLAENALLEDENNEEGTSAVAVNSSFSQEEVGRNNGSKSNDNDETSNRLTIEPLNFDELAYKDVDVDDFDSEPTISSPMSKPTFTVRQMDEIQKDHANEISKLEDIIHEKSESVLSLTNSLNAVQQDCHVLNDKLTTFQIESNKLAESNKMLTMRIASVELMLLKSSKQLKQRDSKINQLHNQAIQFKENYNKVIESLQKNEGIISALQEALESERNQNKDLQVNVGTLTNTISNLKAELNEKSKDIEALINNEALLREQNEQKSENLKHLSQQHLELNDEKILLQEQLEQKLAEVKDLNEFKADLEGSIEECNQRILELEMKNGALVSDMESLSQDFKLKQLESDEQQQEINDLHTSLESKMKELDILFDEKEDMAQTLNRIKNELEEEREVISQVYKDLENERESLNIKTNEFEELLKLNNELSSKLEDSHAQLTELQEQNLQLQDALKEATEKISELKDLLEESAKNESEVVKNLHSDLSSVKEALLSKEEQLKTVSKQRDEFSIKSSEVDRLSEEVDVLKQKLVEQDESNEQKLQQLAQDLYVQYSKKHEQKVSILKKGYQTKWSNKFKDLEAENVNLLREVDSLKKQLSNERDEKNQLVKLWDQLVEMEGPNKKLI